MAISHKYAKTPTDFESVGAFSVLYFYQIIGQLILSGYPQARRVRRHRHSHNRRR